MMSGASAAVQAEIDDKNRSYWDTLCGSQLAKMLGINDFSLASLQRFDAYFLGYYPYLFYHVPLDVLWRKKILEIGLGYGTVAQLLAATGDYTGLDIAQGPVDMVNERLRLTGLPGRAVQGSILAPPFAPESFDAVVTIGCLHHTGDLAGAINQIERLLKPGGSFHFMLYNAYSYRRWGKYPLSTLKHVIHDYFGGPTPAISQAERTTYDADAPETVFTSARQVRRLLKKGFSQVHISRENAVAEGPLRFLTRAQALKWLSPLFGLDLYISAAKRVA